jgi:hypothetical protein
MERPPDQPYWSASMNWHVFMTSPSIRPNHPIEFTANGLTAGESAPLLAAGDRLTVEYPDNTRASGSVVTASGQDAVIEIGGRRWQAKFTGTSGMRATWLIIDAA